MMAEEPLRSKLMYRQVEAFEEKVKMCFDRFDVTLFYSMVRQLSQQSSVYDLHSVRQLRQVYDDEIARTNCRSLSQAQLQNKCLQYFTWFCKFLTYLRNLLISFNSRIFVPLFKYFLQDSHSDLDRCGSTSSSLSKYSNMSFASTESGIMSDSEDSDRVEEADDFDDAAAMACLRTQSHTALMLLSKEFSDITNFYDKSDIKKVAHKLSFIKENLEFNMDEDESIESYLLSEESARVIEHLNADDEIDSLLRYVPDILFKFKNAAKLARKWLQLDDQRSLNFTSKLQKIAKLEGKMTERLTTLVTDIKKHEIILESDSEELQRLLQREERSNNLSAVVYDLDERMKNVNETLRKLKKEKIIIINKLVNAVQKRMKRVYTTQKVLFESNRLQRYSFERELATLQFRRDLAEADMYVEIAVKPHLIRGTNDLQDNVEQLEQIIEEKKQEENTIKSALIPIQTDLKSLNKIVHPFGLPLVNNGLPSVNTEPKRKVLAHYLGSKNVSNAKSNKVKMSRNAYKLPRVRLSQS